MDRARLSPLSGQEDVDAASVPTNFAIRGGSIRTRSRPPGPAAGGQATGDCQDKLTGHEGAWRWYDGVQRSSARKPALRAAGCQRAYLYTHENNERALAVYTSAGYRPDGATRDSNFREVHIRDSDWKHNSDSGPNSARFASPKKACVGRAGISATPETIRPYGQPGPGLIDRFRFVAAQLGGQLGDEHRVFLVGLVVCQVLGSPRPRGEHRLHADETACSGRRRAVRGPAGDWSPGGAPWWSRTRTDQRGQCGHLSCSRAARKIAVRTALSIARSLRRTDAGPP
jgi:hypothetical protein